MFERVLKLDMQNCGYGLYLKIDHADITCTGSKDTVYEQMVITIFSSKNKRPW